MKKTIKDLLWVSTCVALMLSLLTSCSITASKDSQQGNTESIIDSKVETITFESDIENTEVEVQKTELITDIESFEDIDEIVKLLNDFKSFSDLYIFGDVIYNFGDTTSIIFTDSDGTVVTDKDPERKKWYKLIGGEIKTYSQLIQKTEQYCTLSMTNSYDISNMFELYYLSVDNQLYINDVAGTVGFMGYDTIYIDSIKIIDSDRIQLNMNAFGNKEDWGYEEDITTPFIVVLKKENNVWKIDQWDDSALSFLTGNNLVYSVGTSENN